MANRFSSVGLMDLATLEALKKFARAKKAQTSASSREKETEHSAKESAAETVNSSIASGTEFFIQRS
jgi:hypothetical protein